MTEPRTTEARTQTANVPAARASAAKVPAALTALAALGKRRWRLESIRVGLLPPLVEPQNAALTAEHAGVALILVGRGAGLELGFIRRAKRDGDPWSGHSAFPGGRAQASDLHLAAVAERETREEIGLSLGSDQRLGALGVIPFGGAAGRERLVLGASVYYVGERRPRTCVAPREVAEVFWVPLRALGERQHGVLFAHPHAGERRMMAGIQYGEHLIWGMTLRVLHCFGERFLPRRSAADESGARRAAGGFWANQRQAGF